MILTFASISLSSVVSCGKDFMWFISFVRIPDIMSMSPEYNITSADANRYKSSNTRLNVVCWYPLRSNSN